MIVLTGFEMPLVVRGSLDEAKTKETLEAVKKIIIDNKGEVGEIEEWGKKNLHYPISKETSGYYYLINFEADKKALTPIVKKLSLQDDAIRYLLLKKEAPKARVRKSKSSNTEKAKVKETITIIR